MNQITVPGLIMVGYCYNKIISNMGKFGSSEEIKLFFSRDKTPVNPQYLFLLSSIQLSQK